MKITKRQLRLVIREKLILEETSAFNVILDVVGLVPGLGEFADAVNAVDYARKGDYLLSAFSLISMVPTIGDAVAKGGKISLWVSKAFPKGSKFVGKHGPDIIEKINKAKDLIKKNKGLIDKLFDKIEKDEKFKEAAPHMSKIKEALTAFVVSDVPEPDQTVSENTIRKLVGGKKTLRITKRQLRRIIKEALVLESLETLVKKHAKAHGGRSINDNIADAMADPEFAELGVSEDELADAMEAYHDKMMGLY